ncbi:MAG: hypothetical protein HQL91_09705 [Magnetococcales bacterium]|nr:hypothetical protein [Magnetococcales bacterium]
MNKLWLGMVGVAVLLTTGPVWAAAANTPEKEEQFKARKAREIQNLESKLTCLKAANTPADLKHCHDVQKERLQDEKLQRIQEQRKKLDEREQSLKEQKEEREKEQKDQKEQKKTP